MQKKIQFKFPAWLFVVLALVYEEAVFQLWTGAALTLPRALTMLLFTLSWGLLLGLLSSFGSDRVCRIAALVLAALFAAVYFAEYLMHDAYGGDGGYMSLGIILGTAADAGNDFGGTIVSVVLHELWRLGVLLLPTLVYGVFAIRLHWGRGGGWLLRGGLALGCAACLLLGSFCAGRFDDAAHYGSGFHFVDGVNRFGLLTAFRLDLQSGDRELDFALETQMPTLPEPALPTEAPATEAPTAPEETETEPEQTEPFGPHMTPEKPYNTLDIDFAALAESESNRELAKLDAYVASLTPAKTNACTGLFAGKSLIFISAEAFSAEVIDPVRTPALYRLAHEGVFFTDYYQPAWGGSTSTGEYANMTGLVPTTASAMGESIGKQLPFTLGNQLMAQGYASWGFHNNSYTYYNRDRTHQNLGCGTWMAMGNGMEEGVANTWPQSDREMLDFTMDIYLSQRPFYVYYMSVSGHGLYSQGGNFMSKKNYEAVSELDCSETVKCYHAANLELEYALEDLLDRLETEGLLDDVVIVLSPDHYPYCLEQSATWHTDRDYLSELYGGPVTDCFIRDHNALILWSGCIEGMGLQIDTPVSSLDITPTLLNLFGLDYDSRLLVGRDVFSDAEPLVFWNNGSWITDRARYDAASRRYTVSDGMEADEAYFERIDAAVSNKISYSRGVIRWDYFRALFGGE